MEDPVDSSKLTCFRPFRHPQSLARSSKVCVATSAEHGQIANCVLNGRTFSTLTLGRVLEPVLLGLKDGQ